MKKKILILVLLSFSILLGCTKSDLEIRHEGLTSNSSLEATNYFSNVCKGKICHTCKLCRGPHYISCKNKCICFTIDGHHTDCMRCGGCIDMRVAGAPNRGCSPCQCLFFSQVGKLDCFLTAMSYVGKITGSNITRFDMEQAFFATGINYTQGIYPDEVAPAMQAVFGSNFSNKTGQGYDMRYLLDDNLMVITNYRVETEKEPYGHAVVVVGYSGSGNNLRYTCLDPATGEYVYKYWDELEWKKSDGSDSINKFLVAVSNFRW